MAEDCQVVKVKFKGKFALGESQKYPPAHVDEEFLSNLTDLNILLLRLSGLPVPEQKRTAADAVPSTRSKKRSEDVKSVDLPPTQPPVAKKPKTNEIVTTKISVPAPLPVEERDPTVSVLCLPIGRNVEAESTYYSSAQNAKTFAKALAAMDPTEMSVKCDFDFWVWLETQKYFHPFSAGSHDVQVLSLQEIGENNPWIAYLNSLPPDDGQQTLEPDSSSGPVADVVSEALVSKNKELIKVNLQVNRLISKIRKQIQTPEVRNESLTAAKCLEKDKLIVSRWAKAKKKHK